MFYTVREGFGPEAGEKWKSYLVWRGLPLSQFDSIDGILRPNLFDPVSSEDWENCVHADFSTHLITNVEYGRVVRSRHRDAVLLGVEAVAAADHPLVGDRLLGFDILDGYSQISLLTNWGSGGDVVIDQHVLPNGLVGELAQVLRLRDLLRTRFPDDPHAADCGVWAVHARS